MSCDACDNGTFETSGCPQNYIAEIVDVLPLVDFMEKGVLPVAGGALDQAAWFMRAASAVNREDRAAIKESYGN